MVSSLSTGHSRTNKGKGVVTHEREVPISFSPFAPLVADATALARCVEVADNGQSSKHAEGPSNVVDKGKKILRVDCQGLLQVGDSLQLPIIPPPPTVVFPFVPPFEEPIQPSHVIQLTPPPLMPAHFIPPPPPPTTITFLVKSGSLIDNGKRYVMEKTTPFFMVYKDYARKLVYDGSDIFLRRQGGQYVAQLETPEDIALEDEEIFIASGKNLNMNLNTEVRKFVIKDCSPVPRKMKFKTPLRTSMRKVARRWCAYSNMDLGKVIFISHNALVCQIGRLGQTQISNQDVVSVFTLN